MRANPTRSLERSSLQRQTPRWRCPWLLALLFLALGGFGCEGIDTHEIEAEGDTTRFGAGDGFGLLPDGSAALACPGCPGVQCAEDEDCRSGACIEGPSGRECAATCVDSCPAGYACLPLEKTDDDTRSVCLYVHARSCRPCKNHGDCLPAHFAATETRCVATPEGRGSFCATPCDADEECPEGAACEEVAVGDELLNLCRPVEGECGCSQRAIADGASTACTVGNELGTCWGQRFCAADGLTDCDAPVPAVEVCNGRDDDCNGETDDSGEDTDADGVDDCADLDDDGDGVADDDDVCPKVPDVGQLDLDGDGAGDACDADDDGDGIADDEDNCIRIENPLQEDLDGDGSGDACEGDTDGDGIADADDICRRAYDPEQGDQDGDGTGDACDEDIDGDGHRNDVDCSPADVSSHPQAHERCDGRDTDCDGKVDEENAIGCSKLYLDADGDGFGTKVSRCLCGPAEGYAAEVVGDCDDGDPKVHPQAAETCETPHDDNCDGDVLEPGDATGVLHYVDLDGDGYGAGRPERLCGPTTLFTAVHGDDCDDENPGVRPEADELCNGEDDDCDGGVDETFPEKGGACDGLDEDECEEGTLVCNGVALVCDDDPESKVEECNGEDDDCDGQVDEGFLADEVLGDGDLADAWRGVALGTYPAVSSGVVKGKLLPAGDEDWFSVRVDSEADAPAKGEVTFTAPGSGVWYRVCACWSSEGSACSVAEAVCARSEAGRAVKVEVALSDAGSLVFPVFLDVQVSPDDPAEDRSCFAWEARWRVE